MKDEMELVLENRYGKVKGWVPLKEMQTRAEIYDVDLYDIYETVKVEKHSVNNFSRNDRT
jgi:hypothetical protein